MLLEIFFTLISNFNHQCIIRLLSTKKFSCIEICFCVFIEISLASHYIHGLTYWCRDKMATISQTTLSNVFLWMKLRILITISLKFVAKDSINNTLSLVQIMAWRRPGDKPLSVPLMARLLMHICFSRPQWVKYHLCRRNLATVSA